MSDLATKRKKSHNLEETIAMGLYKNKMDRIIKIIDIIESRGGERKSIDEIRKTWSKVGGSMSDFVISERE